MTTTPVDLDIRIPTDNRAQALRADVRAGLTGSPKSLPPKWFYDAHGSDLFDAITELDEYYPTRTERQLIVEHADDIAALTGTATLIELGSGSSDKTRRLIDAMSTHRDDGSGLQHYAPLDVSPSALRGAVGRLRAEYPGLRVDGIVADFTGTLAPLPGPGPRTVAFLGGTIGNLEPTARKRFLTNVSAALEPGEHFLLGAGLVADETAMQRAYDDASGVTAAFNRNVLTVVNRELGADFDVDSYRHVAVWNADDEWIEMRLRATHDARVHIPGADLAVDVAADEEILTEISAKFRPDTLSAELAAVGLPVQQLWTDPADRFAIFLSSKRL
ncbi:L-histidine N(alpha)-methyltransferase [Jongsikchunia kroppenstedtii]|uniref:L-histidine N(alpha)-methyltransferase n=1 Tax=Jongsikchunia kroppenstedtii TaxID=1121721 RepID=UPI0003719C94|nr:L-histidine N(alpha)-methyltransferase [Jongsikchunia kroppenstedtii]